MTRKNMIAIGVGIFALVALTAGASALVTRHMFDEKSALEHTAAAKPRASGDHIAWNNQRQAAAPAQPACDDGNVVGSLLGGVGGGVAGSQLGKGNGKTATTIGGTLGGAYLGGQYIPTRNVTCRR